VKRGIHLVLALVSMLPASRPASAQMDEYSIKAGYLYNFSKYVEWPEGTFQAPATPFVICIVGVDPFGGRLDQAIAGKTSGDARPLEVRRFKKADAIGLRACQMAFLSKSEMQRTAALVDTLKNLPIFTVADFAPFADIGGIADLRIDGTKVKVDLNMNAANRAKLKISGKLQRVANLVN
jgi:hypothetical protein